MSPSSGHRHDASVQCGLFDVDHDDSVSQVLEKSGPDAEDDFDESDTSFDYDGWLPLKLRNPQRRLGSCV